MLIYVDPQQVILQNSCLVYTNNYCQKAKQSTQ